MEAARDQSGTIGTRVIAAVAILGVLALGGLIVRELMPHHGVTHASSAPEESVPEATAPPAVTAAPARPKPRPAASATTAAAPAPPTKNEVAAPHAAVLIAQVAADPDAFAPSTVYKPLLGPEQLYNFEPLPPFNSTTLRRSKANPKEWELDAQRGPKLKDLGPEGSVRQAAIAKDNVGNQTPWYRIDSGPLAPAYAVEVGRSIRVMSKEYLVANRSDLPPEVAATLDN